MPSCGGRLEEISALLDGELAGDQELELHRHLDECAICAAWRAQLEALSAGVARSTGRERAPRALSERVSHLAPGRTVRGTAAAAALAGVLGALGLFALWTAWPVHSFEEALLEDHHRLVTGEVALEVPSPDPAVVANILGDRLPFRVEVARVADARLRGGHACQVKGRHAAYLQYERSGERVSVFAYPRSGATSEHGWRCRSFGGESVCTFDDTEQTVSVVASTPSAARDFRSAIRVVSMP